MARVIIILRVTINDDNMYFVNLNPLLSSCDFLFCVSN